LKGDATLSSIRAAIEAMKVGDKIRLVRVPQAVKDDGKFRTRTILTECLGHIFTLRGFQGEDGMAQVSRGRNCWLELEMGEAIPGSLDTIWVEPDCVELVRRSAKKQRRAK